MNVHIISLQLYQFTIEFSVILLSSDGPELLNYSIHRLSAGLSFQRETGTIPEDHPHPLSVSHSVVVLHANSFCESVCMDSMNTETCKSQSKIFFSLKGDNSPRSQKYIFSLSPVALVMHLNWFWYELQEFSEIFSIEMSAEFFNCFFQCFEHWAI